jgi:hypothetical protein
MGAPLTQTQLPLESILDLNGKQTYLGNAFILPQNGKQLTDTSEHPIMYISNPAGSGKSLFMYQRKYGTDNNNAILRFYFNPTINALNSATVPVNLRTSATQTSVSNCYLSSTITSNGTLFKSISITVYTIDANLLFIIDPGTSYLITAQQVSGSSGNSDIYIENTWYEI